jgi:hypothetical protein
LVVTGGPMIVPGRSAVGTPGGRGTGGSVRGRCVGAVIAATLSGVQAVCGVSSTGQGPGSIFHVSPQRM